MTLSFPLKVADLKGAHPRSTRGMGDGEISVQLRLMERSLRARFRVSATSHDAVQVLRDAMLVAWPSFLIQMRQVSQESSGTEQHSATYHRAGQQDFKYSDDVAAMLAPFADADPAAAESGAIVSRSTPIVYTW